MVDADLSREVVGRVREAADLVEVVKEHVRLRKRGRTWEGLCPFHEEKTPSFSVDSEKGLYYCFGCHQGGDVFKFVMQLEHLSFPETVERLARQFGVQLPPRSPDALKRRKDGERQRTILQEAQHWFAEGLEGHEAGMARTELERRGFEKSEWKDYGFGFAPDDWRRLLEHLTRRHPEGKIIDAGLAIRPEGGTAPYDRFRNRLTFPIRSGDGQLVGFGGRVLGDGEPKYLNSPESQLFRKRSTLFALDLARRSLAETGRALVVEGYFDCLSLHRVGVRNVVATLGTALTQEHARLLRRRLGDEGQVILCYDADDAGRRAAGTGARVLLEAGVEVSVLTLPQGMDPDDVVRERGVDTVHELLDSPKPLLEFLLLDIPTEPSRRRRAGLRLAPLVCSASDAAVRQNLVEELARHLYLRPREVEEAGRQPRRSQAVAQSTVRAPVPPGERELVRILLECSGEWRRRILELVHRDLFEDERVRKVLEEAGSVLKSDAEQADFVGELMQRCTDSDAANLVAELGNSKMPDITDETIRLQLQTIVQRQAQERSLRLAPLIAAAEASGNSSELDRLLAEKARLRQYSVEF